MFVLAFDRDWTVDVNPHPRHEAVPLEWVRHWAHETEHEVWAIGNQDLVDEADIPGTVESIRRRDGDVAALGEQDEFGYYEWWPEREERLHILADLFPDATGYVVVDDLDLGHVEGWDHYHAWEFVEQVRHGDIPLDTPPSSSGRSDGGFASPDAVREILAEGWLFEVTYRDDGETRTFMLRHTEPDRPSMKPLEGPPTFVFEPLTGETTHRIRFPDLEDVTSVSAEHIPAPLTNEAVTAIRKAVAADRTVPVSDIAAILSAAGDDDAARANAVTLAYVILQERDDAFEELGEHVLSLLHDAEAAAGRSIVRDVIETARESPAVVGHHASELAALASESAYEEGAVRCFAVLAEANPAYALEGVPALATAATAQDEDTRRWAVYALSQIADAYPEEVYPAVETLLDAMRAEDDLIRTNALSAVGRITSSYPDAVAPVAADLVDLLGDEDSNVRSNAVGLFGDIAQQHPDVVIEYAAEIAGCLDDSNEQARINASIALLEAWEADPEAIRARHEQLEAALDDPNPVVRANACALVGNAEAPVPTETLRTVRESDQDETVREQAAWALSRIS